MNDEWPPRFKMKEMTIEESARFLRELCEVTASRPDYWRERWDNTEQILWQFLTDAYRAGVMAGATGRQQPMNIRGIDGVTTFDPSHPTPDSQATASSHDSADQITGE